MAFIPVPNAVEARLIFSDDGQQAVNTLYFDAGGAPSIDDLLTLAEVLGTWWASQMAPLLCDTLTLNEVICSDLSIEAGLQTSVGVSASGAVTSEAAPNNVAACISFRTGLRGRNFRGRNYIAGVPNSAIGINTLTTDFIGGAVAAYQQLLETGSAPLPGLYTWSVVSRYSGVDPATGKPIPRTTGIFTHVNQVVFTDNVVDSQRRRLPGRGR